MRQSARLRQARLLERCALVIASQCKAPIPSLVCGNAGTRRILADARGAATHHAGGVGRGRGARRLAPLLPLALLAVLIVGVAVLQRWHHDTIHKHHVRVAQAACEEGQDSVCRFLMNTEAPAEHASLDAVRRVLLLRRRIDSCAAAEDGRL